MGLTVVGLLRLQFIPELAGAGHDVSQAAFIYEQFAALRLRLAFRHPARHRGCDLRHDFEVKVG